MSAFLPAGVLFGFELNTPMRWYFFLPPLVKLVYVGLRNIAEEPGRAGDDGDARPRAGHHVVGVDVRILRLQGLRVRLGTSPPGSRLYYLQPRRRTFGIQFAISSSP